MNYGIKGGFEEHYWKAAVPVIPSAWALFRAGNGNSYQQLGELCGRAKLIVSQSDLLLRRLRADQIRQT